MADETRGRILIVAEEGDLHALAARKALAEYHDVECHVVASDRLYGVGGLSWSNIEPDEYGSTLPTVNGEVIDVRAIDVVWFRRLFGPQIVGDDIIETAYLDLINSHFPSAVLGVLLGSFTGRWISDPGSTRIAENKLLQLHVARCAGLATPRTLVSTEPDTIRRFCSAVGGEVVVKGLRQSANAVLMTQIVRPEHLESAESMRMCPAIYQEYVPGGQHLRVHIFGNYVSTMLIESTQLDWRQNLDVPCRPYSLDEKVVVKLRRVLDELNLRMGIFDLKLNDSTPIWLELNPQGQFLFAEGLSGIPLNFEIARFLRQEAVTAARMRRSTTAGD
jgi:hypothetical protein